MDEVRMPTTLFPTRAALALLLGCVLAAPVLGQASIKPGPPGPRGFPNDNCGNPMPVAGIETSFQFNTDGATTGPQGQNNPACLFGGVVGIANDLWYVWTAPVSGTATLRSCGTTPINTKAAVYAAAGCPPAPAIACNDDACDLQSALTFTAVAGETYTFQVGKFPGTPDGPGAYVLSVAPTPLNDTCAEALPIGEGDFPFSNVGATTDGPPACGPIEADVWFRYTPTDIGFVSIQTCGTTGFDTVIQVLEGGCVGGVPVACNDDFCAHQSAVFFDAVPGREYLIRVGGVGGATGDGIIIVTRGPPCVQQCPPGATPEGEPCGFDTNGGCSTNERFLTIDCDAVICGSLFADAGTRDVDWYRFTLDAPGQVAIGLTAELPASVFLIPFEGACPVGQPIAATDTPPCGVPGAFVIELKAGSYVIVVTAGTIGAPVFEGFPCGGQNAYTLGVALPGDCSPDEQFFGGLQHTSLGVATLTPGSIIIDNTGNSGTNGVSVAVGPTAEGWRCEGVAPPGPLPIGTTIVAAATGTVGGLPDNTLGLARLDATLANRLRLTPDFAPIGATRYTLRAFNGPTQVFVGSGRSGPAFDRANNGNIERMTFACAPEPCFTPPCPQTEPFIPTFEFRFPVAGGFQIIGGPAVNADRFLITPEAPQPDITSVSDVALTIAGVEPLTLDAEAISFRRLFHIARGVARFDASGGELGLNSMSNSGGDGFTVELDPRTGHYVAQLEPLGDPADPANPIPDGAFINYIARGIVNGVPETVYSSSHYEDVGTVLETSFDFTPTGTDELLVVYVNNGVPVGTETLAGSTAAFTADEWVLTLEKTYDSCGVVVCQRPCWVPAATIISPFGISFTAEFLEVVAINPTETFTGYTSADILFSDIPAARIVNEVVEFIGTCCECDFNDGGGLNSQDFFDFLSCFFGEPCPAGRTADYNADGLVNSQDFFDFLGCFFMPPPGCG
jgi:hypothetical protein